MADQDNHDSLFSINDAFAIRNPSEIKFSPDGGTIAFVTTIGDLSKNLRSDHLTLISVSDRERRIAAEGSSPQWSPDGLQIAYLGSLNGQDGLCLYNLKEDSTKFLCPIHTSHYFINHSTAQNFAWSPDGRYIAFVSASPPAGAAKENDEVKEINRLLYKTKGGFGRPFFADDALTHVWIIPSTGGMPEIITPGPYNEHSISVSPDGQDIAFVSNRSDDPDNNQECNLWRVNIRTKQITRLTAGPGTVFQPGWSPDGRHIAYLAITSRISTNDSLADDTQLFICPAEGGTQVRLSASLDRRVENVRWHPEGKWIYFTAGNHGAIPLYRVSLDGARLETVLTQKSQILEYDLNAKRKAIAFVETDSNHPPEIFVREADKANAVRLTTLNDQLVDNTSFRPAEEFWFRSFDETRVQGWLLRPAGLDESKTYPLVLVIHGGPHNMVGHSFDPAMQLLAAHGYGVVFMNPRGSSGYGQAFSRGTVLNWGGGDYQDLMAGVDHVLDAHKWISRDRLGVMGQSYGGYMTNWIITQTNRFKAAISDGGISNLISFAGTSLYHSLMESEFNGSVYDNFPLLWQWSPLRNVKNVRTPTLFLHGTRDNEVPVSQAEEMYIALKKLGVPASFVQYLQEGHGWRPDLKPANRADLYGRVQRWFHNYLM
jgi:dipeptidyl aminopeptidase/acylaminoacyl peptidase